jgi:hypothetical protein
MTVCMFVGQVIGTISGSSLFLSAGWRACYALALGFTGLQLLVLLSRGPHIPDTRWLGWAGGWALRRSQRTVHPPIKDAKEEVAAMPDNAVVGDVEQGHDSRPEKIDS